MKIIAVAIIASTILGASGPATADMPANRINEAMPASIHDKHDGQGAQSAGPSVQPTHGHRPDAHHPHRVVAIFVYVPTGPLNAPYYYAPDTPVYVDQDPPVGAYREPNGFYYWCADPAGYFPYQPDCSTGWRLVAL